MDKNVQITIGQHLKTLRQKSRLSQETVATAATLSVRHYQSIEYGKVKCRLDTLEKILNIHGLTLSRYFESYPDYAAMLEGESALQLEAAGRVPTRQFVVTCDSNGVLVNMPIGLCNLTGIPFGKGEGSLHIWDILATQRERDLCRELLKSPVSLGTLSWSGQLAVETVTGGIASSFQLRFGTGDMGGTHELTIHVSLQSI